MNILILGKTQSGKTTLSNYLAKELNMQTYSMSKMFRDSYEQSDHKISLTDFSKKIIFDNIDANLIYISNYFEQYIQDIDNVIFEGFRNPYELMHFLRKDTIVIYLNDLNKFHKDYFEEIGLKACIQTSNFFKENRLISNYIEINFENYDVLNKKIKEIKWNS